jgi:MobA/MobL family protein
MALYHVHLSYVSKGQQAGGARGFHQYLSREGIGDGVQFHRYLEREGNHGRDDLIAKGHGHLPAWAQDSPERFWATADRLERKNGPVFYHLQVTLPRELSPASREELAHDIMETLVERYPHSWAIHEPMAKDGSGIQPHVHIQFSTRREDVEHNLSADQWFKQPNHGGIAKDISWRTKSRLYDVRASVALLTNAALGREGLTLAVDHRTLEAQGISRDPTRYGSTHDKADLDRTLDYRRELRESGTLAYEALHVYAGWQDQAVKLLSLDREYIRDLTRDHLWRYDRSPARELERQYSMERTLELAMSERQPTRTLERTREPAQERTTGRDLADQLQDLAARFEQLDEAPVGSGLKVKLWEKEREREQGYGLGF